MPACADWLLNLKDQLFKVMTRICGRVSPQLGYESAPVENSIAVFAAVRAGSLDIVKRLEESDLEKSGVHTEAGHYTIAKWLEGYTNHPKDHGDQLVRALKGLN